MALPITWIACHLWFVITLLSPLFSNYCPLSPPLSSLFFSMCIGQVCKGIYFVHPVWITSVVHSTKKKYFVHYDTSGMKNLKAAFTWSRLKLSRSHLQSKRYKQKFPGTSTNSSQSQSPAVNNNTPSDELISSVIKINFNWLHFLKWQSILI